MTHNFDERLCHEGIVPLAKSFDVPGFFANDLEILLRATKAVLAFPNNNNSEEERYNTNSDDRIKDDVKFVKLEDAFALATEKTRVAIDAYLEKHEIEYETVKLEENQNILEWWDDFRVQQTDDVWKAHGDWIRKRNPKFGPGVHERFYGAEEVSEDTKNVERAREMNRKRAEIIRNEVFRKSKTICIVPAAACAPPKLNEDASVVIDLRVKTLSLSSISGLTGLPQVVVPCVSNKNELPIGVGFIGWERKCDVALLQTLLKKRL
jgi:amidase